LKFSEIAKFKEEKEKEEMKECTFQPNLGFKKINHKEARDNVNNLYMEGVQKLRSKNSKEIKEPEALSMECTFRPKINEL